MNNPHEDLRQKVIQVAALTSALVAMLGAAGSSVQLERIRVLVQVADEYADESLAIAERISRLVLK